MTESMGYLAALAMQPYANLAATTTFSASSARLEFYDHDLKESIELIQDDGLRGTRTRASERLALGNIKIGGSISFEPTPAELVLLMPFILGTASSSGSYVVADTLPNLYLLGDFVNKCVTFTTRVTKATFSGSPGQKIKLKLELVGTTIGTVAAPGVIQAAGVFASANIPAMDLTVRPYMFYDMGSGITINAISYAVDKFELAIDNKIEPTYMQGQTATDLEPTDRVITLGIQTKYTSTESVLQTDTRAGTARAASVAFTNGASVFSFTFGALVAMPESVTVPGRQHLRLPLNYQAYGLSTTKEVVVALPA